MTDYGRCISCTDSLRSGRYVSGIRVVAEAVYRRLITRQGELLDDPDYGMDLSEYCGASVSASDLAMLPGLIKQQVMRDERVLSVDVLVTPSGGSADMTLTVEISVYCDAGPFSLVMSVSETSTALLGISR